MPCDELRLLDTVITQERTQSHAIRIGIYIQRKRVKTCLSWARGWLAVFFANCMSSMKCIYVELSKKMWAWCMCTSYHISNFYLYSKWKFVIFTTACSESDLPRNHVSNFCLYSKWKFVIFKAACSESDLPPNVAHFNPSRQRSNVVTWFLIVNNTRTTSTLGVLLYSPSRRARLRLFAWVWETGIRYM